MMKFSEAIDLCIGGAAIGRKSWTDTIFVVTMPALNLPPFNTQGTDRKVNDRTAKWIGEDTPLNCQPYFSAYKEGNLWQPGWTPNTDDMFADDWHIVG